jgi:hypothetical protein
VAQQEGSIRTGNRFMEPAAYHTPPFDRAQLDDAQVDGVTPPPTFSSSATVNAQFWLEQLPWRPTAAWTVLAALLAIGGTPWQWEWRTIVLVLLLVDPLWGSIWRLAAGRNEILPLQRNAPLNRIWLPYLVPGSPAARLFDWNYARVMPLLFRVGLPSLLLAGAVALVLTPLAFWITLGVFLISMSGWVLRRALDASTTLLHSLVTVTLPWLLTLTIFGQQIADRQWTVHLGLLVLWTLHNWGEGRNLRAVGDSLGLLLLAVAEVGMISLLIFLQAPFWLALLVVLWLPVWLSIYYRRPVQQHNFIWLLAMLLSAWALGQNLG